MSRTDGRGGPERTTRHSDLRVAVIGAGVSGLTTIKALLEVGLSPVAYEATERLGGIWVYREDEDQIGPTYRSLRTNTSKQITAFSDLPFRPEVPNFPTRAQVEVYLNDYEHTFDLTRCVRFGTPVNSITPQTNGTWRVRTLASGEESYDAVLVCSGIFREPVIPPIPGLATFSGTVTHSRSYRVPESFVNQNVLVVGLGSSAVDIAIDLLGSAANVTLSTRRGAWVVPREIDGIPVDHRSSRLNISLPASIRTALRHRLLDGAHASRGVDSPAELWSQRHIPFDPASAPSVTSDELLCAIHSGAVGARPQITSIVRGTVVFADGTELRPDTIIFCSGYSPTFPFLPTGLVPWSGTAGGLYRLVFPPLFPNLGFIGICRVQGPILPIVEMQARWASQILVGSAALPAPSVMQAEIARRTRRQFACGDSVLRVPLIPYLDGLGRDIGVKPAWLRHAPVIRPLLLGPPVAAQYRLQGPNAWPGARRAMRKAAKGA